jgi:hypothetical protein
MRIIWTTKQFEVTLPYTEFWATADAAIGLEITVISMAGPLNAEADFYRRDNSPMNFRRYADENGLEYRFTALGAFLPYQGMFVKVSYEDVNA